MPEETQPTDDDIEETLTFLEKLKRIWEISKWVRAVVMAVKLLFFGTTTAVVVDQVTDSNVVGDVAVQIGLQESIPPDTTKGILQEELMGQLAALQQEINELKKHQHNYPDPLVSAEHPHPYAPKKHEHPHSHSLPKHEHPHSHPATITPELESAIDERIGKHIPDRHLKLHGGD